MSEELGKIEKPSVEEFKGGRKLFFVPLILSGKELPLEFVVKTDNYWDEAESHISNLEAKLGPVNRVYHELVPESGEEGIKLLQELKVGSFNVVNSRFERGAKLEATEDNDILTELMDWSRCLSLGLQNQKVFSKIYEFYTEANSKRNESIAKKLNDTLKENENGLLIMAEGHHIQFPADMKVFYVSPPALDDIKRWLRDYEAKSKEAQSNNNPPPETGPAEAAAQ
jgi:hypothetical protein